MKIFKKKILHAIIKYILVSRKYVFIPCYILLCLFSITLILINIICITYNHSPKAHKMLTAIVAKKTGIDFHINTLEFNWKEFYHPNIIVNYISISQPKIVIQNAYVSIAYQSLWKLAPIFNNIIVNGIKINAILDKSGNLSINQYQIKDSNKSSNLEKISKFILTQHHIEIVNFIISYIDQKRLITVNNQNLHFILVNKSLAHDFLIKLLNNKERFFFVNLSWISPKDIFSLTDPNMFQKDLDIKLIHKSSYTDDNVNYKKLNFATDIKIKDGHIKAIKGDFDIDQKTIDKIPIPSVKGNISLEQSSSNEYDYSVKSNNLKINNSSVDVRNYLEVNGNSNQQQIILKNINLNNLQDELKALKNYMNITLSGAISRIQYNWHGAILHPKTYELFLDTKNLSINLGKNIFFKNLTSNIAAKNGNLHIDLNSTNAILRLSDIFQQDIIFKTLTGTVDANFENNIVNLNGKNLAITTPDFSAKLSVSYSRENNKDPKNFGYLKILASLPYVNANKVDWYLPKTGIPLAVHQYLKMSLIGGHAENASLDLDGNLYDFPFNNGKGKFYIKADVVNGKMLYLDKWPTLNNIMGKFILSNNTITILGNSADCLDKIKINKVKVFLPDFTADAPLLVANGELNSSVSDALGYLSQIPIENISTKIKEYLHISGNTVATLDLKVPLSKPENTTIKVDANLLNNIITFANNSSIDINQINGVITFANNNLYANNITAQIENNPIIINIKPANNLTRININAHTFNYESFIEKYASNLKGIIIGGADTALNIDLNSSSIDHIYLDTNLTGVAINLPAPLHKDKITNKKLSADISLDNGITANINLQDTLQSQMIFVNNQMKQLYVNIGNVTNKNIINSEYKSLVNINTDAIELAEWQKILAPYLQNNGNSSLIDSLYVYVNTKNLMLYGYNLGATTTEATLKDKITTINLKSKTINANIDYSNNIFNIKLNQFNINNILSSLKQSNKKITSLYLDQQLPTINLHIDKLKFNDFEGQFDTILNSDQSNLYTKHGTLSNKDMILNFSFISYCIYCKSDAPSKNALNFNADIKNSGNLIKNITHKNIIKEGSGKLSGSIYWDKLSLNSITTKINGQLTKGYLLKTQGLIERIFSFFSLQGIKDIGNANLFNSDLAFNKLSFDADLDHSVLYVNKVLIVNDFINIFATVDIKDNFNTINGYLIATPQIVQSVAIISGIAAGAVVVATPILIPIIGGAVYFGGSAIGDPLNAVLTNTYCISGTLSNSSLKSCSL